MKKKKGMGKPAMTVKMIGDGEPSIEVDYYVEKHPNPYVGMEERYLTNPAVKILSGEPEITEVLGLLQNSDVPQEYRDSMRQVLRLLAQQAKLVLKGEDGDSAVSAA